MHHTIMLHDDFFKIRSCFTGLDGLDRDHVAGLWNIAQDGVDNGLFDIVYGSGTHVVGPELTGERRRFEINRRVVDAINLMMYGSSPRWENEEDEFPDSLSELDYDRWIGEHEHLIAQYQAMCFQFIPRVPYASVDLYRHPSSGELTCEFGGVWYTLLEIGQ